MCTVKIAKVHSVSVVSSSINPPETVQMTGLVIDRELTKKNCNSTQMYELGIGSSL